MSSEPAGSAPDAPRARSTGCWACSATCGAGEGARALLMLVNVFLILVSYYILKTVREPLILATSVPEVLQRLGIHDTRRGQDLCLRRPGAAADGLRPALRLVRFQGRSEQAGARGDAVLRREHRRLRAGRARPTSSTSASTSTSGSGIFSLSIIAQFWSYANDTYSKEAGRPAVPDHRDRQHARQPARGVDRRADVRGRPRPRQHAVPRRALLLLVTAGLFLLIDRTRRVAARQDGCGRDAPLGGQERLRAGVREPLHPADRAAAGAAQRREHHGRVHSEPHGDGAGRAPSPPAARLRQEGTTSGPSTATTSSGSTWRRS